MGEGRPFPLGGTIPVLGAGLEARKPVQLALVPTQGLLWAGLQEWHA